MTSYSGRCLCLAEFSDQDAYYAHLMGCPVFLRDQAVHWRPRSAVPCPFKRPAVRAMKYEIAMRRLMEQAR